MGRGKIILFSPHFPNPILPHSSLMLFPLLMLALIMGCATPAQKQAKRDWRTICGYTPIAAGYHYSQEELAAMNRVGGWAVSVEDINRRCGN